MEIETASLRAACADLNGQMRGKRLPGSAAARIEFTGLRMPLSTLSLDVLGHLRATLRLSSPAWLAEPKTTSSSADQSTSGWRSASALIGSAARSSARIEESAPP